MDKRPSHPFHPIFLTQLCGLLKVYYRLWSLQCWKYTKQNSRNTPLGIKKGQNTLSKKVLYWNSWHNVFVYKGGNVLQGANSLVFLCGLDVLWLSRSNGFLIPCEMRGKTASIVFLWHRASQLFLQQYSVLCRGVTGGLLNAHLLPLEFIPTNMIFRQELHVILTAH